MTATEMLVELREVLADELPTYGFSDLRALAYLNEGQEKFCEDTGFFTDRSNFSITTEVGVSNYILDQRIIRVESVMSGSHQLGIDAWRTDMETGILSLVQPPTAVITMPLHVWRYPLSDLKKISSSSPEIPKRMHRACIEWAAFKCYGHHDIELEGDSEALKHVAAYKQYVREGRILKFNMDNRQIVLGVNPAMNAGCP